MTAPDRATVCPDCRELQRSPDGRHASGCRYDVGPVPAGVKYRVTAPDGAVLEGTGRHLHPVCAVVARSHADGVWRTFSSHTTVEAAEWRIDRNDIGGLTLTIVDIDPLG